MLALLWLSVKVININDISKNKYLSNEVLEKSKVIDDNIDIEFLKEFEPAL